MFIHLHSTQTWLSMSLLPKLTWNCGKCGERKSKGWFFTFAFSKMWKILWKMYQMHQTHSLWSTLGKLLSNTFKRASSGEEKVKVFLSFQVCDWKCLCKWEKVPVLHCQIGVQLSTVNALKLVSSDRQKVKVLAHWYCSQTLGDYQCRTMSSIEKTSNT